jgi:hypothetical protein
MPAFFASAIIWAKYKFCLGKAFHRSWRFGRSGTGHWCSRKCLFHRLIHRYTRLWSRPGVYNLIQPSGSGIYISKLDVNGNFVWAKQFQTWNGNPYSIAIDAAGNILTTGFYQQIADFDPGRVFIILLPIVRDLMCTSQN